MTEKLQYLFLLPPKFRNGIPIDNKKTFSLLFTLYNLFWCYPDPNQCIKWIRIREKKSSGSGSETLVSTIPYFHLGRLIGFEMKIGNSHD